MRTIFASLLVLSFVFLIKLPEASMAYADYGDYPDMDMNASPNPVGSGARAMGMGGAFISVADDATAASWNPGGLIQLTKPELSMVGSCFSGNNNYRTSGIKDGDIEANSLDTRHLNYFSVVIPFIFLRRNFTFSLNYQHLYEFAQDSHCRWRDFNPKNMIDMYYRDHKTQHGSLGTISPALAFQITPSFSLGLTANFWPSTLLDNSDNGWENHYSQNGEGTFGQDDCKAHAEVHERYGFSGFNMNLGFLYKFDLPGRKRRQFRLGGVIKTPFEATIRHEQRTSSYIQSQGTENQHSFTDSPPPENLSLKMPLSYGLGTSFDFSDSFSVALDLYRTYWNQYLIRYPSGSKLSPINKLPEEEADINPTTQIRFGTEYLIQNPKSIIPLRAGIFYDPEPSKGHPDRFYGASCGTGISYKDLFSLDVAYQFRFGKKRDAESMQGESIPCRITQHFFYASIIYYLF
jgi:long-subunit fatty acid transport protein